MTKFTEQRLMSQINGDSRTLRSGVKGNLHAPFWRPVREGDFPTEFNHFYTDSFGEKIDNPRFLKKDERKIKRLQQRLSKTQKHSKNRVKARNKLGRGGAGAEPASAHKAPSHLKVSRRRNDWVCKLAQRVIQSNDLVAIENLKVRSDDKESLSRQINI